MKKAKAKKSTRKPTELNKANVAKVESALKAEMKKEDQSKCEAIRKVAKKFGSVRRIEIEAAAKNLRLNVATVRTQIQAARA